jgi:hypothetical protein
MAALPIVVEEPAQMVLSTPAFAVGKAFTVTTTASVFVHPVAVWVTVKV